MVPGLIGCSTRENEPPVSSPDSLNTTPSPGPNQTDFPSSCRTEKCSLRACIFFPFAPFTSLLVKTIVHVEKIVTSRIGLHEKPCVSRSPMPSRTLIETEEGSLTFRAWRASAASGRLPTGNRNRELQVFGASRKVNCVSRAPEAEGRTGSVGAGLLCGGFALCLRLQGSQ